MLAIRFALIGFQIESHRSTPLKIRKRRQQKFPLASSHIPLASQQIPRFHAGSFQGGECRGSLHICAYETMLFQGISS